MTITRRTSAADFPVASVLHPETPTPFWLLTRDALSASLHCSDTGLSALEAQTRLLKNGDNSDGAGVQTSLLQAVKRCLREPLSLILLTAGIVSAATGDLISGSIIVVILALSVGLETFQEGRAVRTADALRRSVALKAEVRRDGIFIEVPVSEIVVGDLVRVRAGDIIPADAFILESTAFTANEAALTGEAFPSEKRAGVVTSASAGDACNALFRGAVAQTGEALGLVAATGRDTVFGSAAAVLGQAEVTSPFQRDLRSYGLLTAKLTIALVLVVLTAHMLFGRPVIQSLLFAVALAVGLTPELLPMITTVTLARGADRMAKRKVIVKRLSSIHDLGAMTILCTDKTGTLTSAEISLARSMDGMGTDTPRPAMLGAISADLGGDRGTLDAAMLAANTRAAEGWSLVSRRNFDFNRRLGSVVASSPTESLLITKGAPEAVLSVCTSIRVLALVRAMSDADRDGVTALVKTMAEQGLRSVAIASKPWAGRGPDIGAEDHADLVYEGLCAFADPPKATAAAAVARLSAAGVRLKILSGDDPVVVQRLAKLVGFKAKHVLTGSQIAVLSDDALIVKARSVDIYARLAPDQKARIVRALKASDAIVGYLGDGINDAPALKTADIGLSVAGATGVAQAAADMILLDSDLGVVADGVDEGRRTFANILKYIRMGASSNFGNMLSMAIASLFLPFLPMLPTQILLNNLLYDVSEIGIPFDTVRPEAVARPQVWNLHAIIRFAAIMGPLSSLFDLLTFGGLLYIFKASPAEFRTSWFLESMVTQILVIFIIRTNGRPWRERPHPFLAATSIGALLFAVILPFSPVGAWFGFKAPPLSMTVSLFGVVISYLVCAELLKPIAIRKLSRPRHRRQA
ncbi:magnesium-translocating P-type ATPase [soil metagenome]